MNTQTKTRFETNEKLSHDALLDAAIARVVARWPNVDPAAERATMASWTDRRLATAYLPDGTPDEVYEEAARIYGADDLGLDAEDEKSLV